MANNITKPTLLKTGGSLSRAIANDQQAKAGVSMPIETLMICIDCSGSMRSETPGAQTMLHAAIDAAGMLAGASIATARVGAVAFTEEADEAVDPLTPRGLLKEKLRGFHRHEGGTVFYPAVASAANALLRVGIPGTLRRIIFMSDGEDMPENKQSLVKEVDRCVENKLIIDTVAFGDGAGHALLRWMSERTGGVFKEAKDAHELRKVFLALEAGVRGLLPGMRK